MKKTRIRKRGKFALLSSFLFKIFLLLPFLFPAGLMAQQDSVTVAIPVETVYDDRTAAAASRMDMSLFELIPQQAEPAPEDNPISIQGEGKAAFTISFVEPGDYYYRLEPRMAPESEAVFENGSGIMIRITVIREEQQLYAAMSAYASEDAAYSADPNAKLDNLKMILLTDPGQTEPLPKEKTPSEKKKNRVLTSLNSGALFWLAGSLAAAAILAACSRREKS